MGERKLGMARALHAAGLTPEPIGLMHGFLVERWCDGQRLQRHEKPIAEIARYIATRARLFPARADSGATTERLFEMTKRNVSLALGDAIAASLEPWTRRLDVLRRRIVRIRTDNRLDRHEWLRLADGQLIKCDALDHHAGHDLIGCQDIVWDVAGAMVEFELDARDADKLIASTESASGRHVDRELLGFYRTAYLAFRLGQASLAVQLNGSDPAESVRLRDSAQRYATELQRLLLESSCPATRQESLVG